MASYSNCGYAAIISSLPADFGAPNWTTYSPRSLTHTNSAEWDNSRSGASAVDCARPRRPPHSQRHRTRESCSRPGAHAVELSRFNQTRLRWLCPQQSRSSSYAILLTAVLTNGSGNTATILDSLTERSGILAAQASE